MSKRTLPASPLGSKKKQSTGSLVEKSAIQELRTFRGTPRFEDAMLSVMFGVSSQLGAISRAQEVLLDKIESIAQKAETLQKEVNSMKEALRQQEKSSQSPSWLPSDMELKEWLNLPINSPERMCSMDLTCSETPYLSDPLLTDLPSTSDGFGDLQEWVNLD